MRSATCFVFASLAIISHTRAASVQLAWNANPEKDIAGYELSYGTATGIYPNKVNAGSRTTATVNDLQDGITYFFVVAARNNAGQLGPKSNPVAYTPSSVRAGKPPRGLITTPETTITIEAGEQVKFAGEGISPKGKAPLTYRWDFGAGSGIPDSSAPSPGKRRFHRPGTYTVAFTVTNSLGVSDPTPALQTVIVTAPAAKSLSRKLWKLKYVDSQEPGSYSATNAFDGNPATFWHTRFTNVPLVNEPHEIQIDLRKDRNIRGFQYLPRQDGFNVGDIGKYKFYVSMDGKKWGKPVASGSFESSTDKKRVFFTPKRGRYIRLRSLTEANGYTDTNVAELQIYKAVSKKKSTVSATTAASHQAAPASSSPAASAPTSGNPGNPTTIPAGITTEVIDGKKYLALTVTKPLVPDGVKRTVQVSPDLVDWFSGKKHTTVLTDNESILKVRDNTPVTRDNKRYIRLKSGPR